MKRKILFDLGHPGHFHLFKLAILYFKKHPNYEVFVTTRNIPMILSLLNSAQIEYQVLGSKRNGILGKFFSVVETDLKMFFFVLKNKIDLGLHCGIVVSHVSLLTNMRSWIFDDDDDEVEPLMVHFSHPISEVVFTPNCIKRRTKRAIYYPGTHELSYLYSCFASRNDFKEKYSIVRLVAFNGHHDVGHSGLSDAQLITLVSGLERMGDVFITSEKPLSEKWEKYRICISPDKMHDFMSRAMVVVGDSQTMISEAATMGVPAFKCNSFAGALSVPNMLEREFGLCFSFKPNQFDLMMQHIVQVCDDRIFHEKMIHGAQRFRKEKINTSTLMIRCVEDWELDFRRMSEYKSEEWLSLCSNFEP